MFFLFFHLKYRALDLLFSSYFNYVQQHILQNIIFLFTSRSSFLHIRIVCSK
ncbi:hypothetical protein EMIT019CA3_10690 [Bacillus pseudomycoides]